MFTTAQMMAFFMDAAQMAVPLAMRVQLVVEGVATVDNLMEFDDDTLKQLFENLKKPGGTIPAPGARGVVIATPVFVLGAKSQQHLKTAMHAARCHEMVGCDLTPGNMHWDQVLKNFQESHKALSDRKDEETPKVPMITKALPIMRWTEVMRDHLHQIVGARMAPLSYVIHDNETPDAVAPALAVNHRTN